MLGHCQACYRAPVTYLRRSEADVEEHQMAHPFLNEEWMDEARRIHANSMEGSSPSPTPCG